jgi:23S rRNA (adenine2503-C2)-methyltransferase
VVLMGMGEPLANFDAVVSVCQLLTDDNAYGLSRRRVTLSTSGLVPALERLSEHTDVALAVSLHAPNDALRNRLVPINRKYPLADLLDSCRRYVEATDAHSGVTFEYVLLAGMNDQPEHADQLARLLRGIPGKINLIPFNPFPGAPFERPEEADVLAFERRLQKAGYVTTVRRTRGDDIDAACGQLVGQVEDRSRRGMRMFRLHAELPGASRRAS